VEETGTEAGAEAGAEAGVGKAGVEEADAVAGAGEAGVGDAGVVEVGAEAGTEVGVGEAGVEEAGASLHCGHHAASGGWQQSFEGPLSGDVAAMTGRVTTSSRLSLASGSASGRVVTVAGHRTQQQADASCLMVGDTRRTAVCHGGSFAAVLLCASFHYDARGYVAACSSGC